MRSDTMAGGGVGRRWLFIVAGVLALGVFGGLGGGLYWALGTCQPLDRWLGISGCRQRIIVSDFDPLPFRGMVWPRGQQTISLFGTDAKAGRRAPLVVRIEIPGGQERDRYPLPARGQTSIRTSADGARAMLYCYSRCNEINYEKVVLVSVADGQIIPWPADSGMPDHRAFYRPFPGEEGTPLSGAEVNLTMGVGGALSPDRKYIAKLSPDTNSLLSPRGEVVLSARGDGSVVRSMTFEKRKGASWYGAERTVLQFSPSGRLIAFLDQQPFIHIRDSIVYIWDVESGRHLASIKSDRRVAADLLWSWDEKSIILNSVAPSERGATAVDIFDWRRRALFAGKAGSP